MRHGDEGVQVLEALYALLTGSQDLADALGVPLEALGQRVWAGVAPEGTPSPWVVYDVTEANDVVALGSQPRLLSAVPATAKVIGQTANYDALAPAARALSAALHGRLNVAVTGGGVVLTITRTGTIQYPEVVQGIQYRHLGHRLSVNVQ
jgi:hypothetical protein